MDKNACFASLTAGIPPEVVRLLAAGHGGAADARIEALLAEPRLPAEGKKALLAAREMFHRQQADYTVPKNEALAWFQKEIPDFRAEELDALLAAGRIDWRYFEGEPRLLDSFLDSLRMYPDMAARGLHQEPDDGLRDRVIAAMESAGHLAADITIKATLAPATPAEPGTPCRVWLPIPAACGQQSEIQILEATPGGVSAPETAPQRAMYWDGRAGQAPFSVTYRYHIDAPCLDMDALAPAADQLCPDAAALAEQAPHILFTPYMKALAAEVTAGCTNNLQKARAIYDYVTQNIRYRYQPAYACLPGIAESCAKSGWGDCGVMALLFITLCRIAGVPARWQSGLYVRPGEAGSHDWAQFYLAPYGWLWADCSFGSGAHRMGNEHRRRHYFGNLDPLRMVANRAFYAQLTPPVEDWRNDPYDNQSGELLLDGRCLMGEQRLVTREVLEYRTTPALL